MTGLQTTLIAGCVGVLETLLPAAVLLVFLFVGTQFRLPRAAQGHVKIDRDDSNVSQSDAERLDGKKQQRPAQPYVLLSNSEMFDKVVALGSDLNNVVQRHLQPTCHAMFDFDKNTAPSRRSIVLRKSARFRCYGCARHCRKTHPVYVYSCEKCGDLFQSKRHISRDLSGQVALVTGGRAKLGHQIALKLLRAGARVVITTRSPAQAIALFRKYSDADEWFERLAVYPAVLDFDVPDLQRDFDALAVWLAGRFGSLDVLVNCAAQTIRCREKKHLATPLDNGECNRYGDAKFVHERAINSWTMNFFDVTQAEVEEVLRVNATAPLLLVSALLPLMENSKVSPHIVNVHAREGLIDVPKSPNHVHTNMAKVALHMLTAGLVASAMKTNAGRKFVVNGCDPGWFSVDEYGEKSKPFVVPPLDEVDGAARILNPLFEERGSCRKTRRHFNQVVC